jgi:hypothetical protein
MFSLSKYWSLSGHIFNLSVYAYTYSISQDGAGARLEDTPPAVLEL